MTNVTPHELPGAHAIAYFASIFEANGKPAPANLADVLRGGKIFALAPEDICDARLLQFTTGGLAPIPEEKRSSEYVFQKIGNWAEYLAKEVCSHLRAKRFSIFIREPYLQVGGKSKIISELSFVADGLYKIIGTDIIEQGALTAEIRKFTVPWSFLLIVAPRSSGYNDIDEMVAVADLIAVGAYDGESYLYWYKTKNGRLQ